MKGLLLVIVSCLVACPMLAQTTPTDEEILKQYERWSGMRDDWPNFARYQADNEALAPVKKGEKRIVFMGNSITDAWIRVSPEFFEGKPYVDRGISGQTTPQMLVRFRPDVLNLDPYAVVILAGTNDVAGNTGPSTQAMITDNLASMAQLATANGIKVIMASVLPAFNYRWRPEVENVAAKIVALNEWIAAYCEDNGHIYLDYHSAMKDERDGLPESLSGDGVHPNKEGYRIMEKLVSEAIARAIEE